VLVLKAAQWNYGEIGQKTVTYRFQEKEFKDEWGHVPLYKLQKWIGNETDGTKYVAHTTHRGLSPSRVPAAPKELKLLGQEGDPLQSHCTQTH
jgi:hypothetical protein